MGINDFIKIGTKIKEVRKRKGIKQKEMAKKLGIPVSTYANYENNHREPSTEVLDTIANILGTSVSELIGIDSFNSFTSYLESIGYKLEFEPEVLEWHYEDVVENGKVVGKAQVSDKETYIVTIKNDKVAATYTEAEFEELQNTIKNSVDYQVWLKNNK